jgi:tetratricopeptide (TPR) repeat protein
LESNRSVLEAKLREALAARPAALDPRELNKAEGRIKSLEKEKEVLRVSLQVAEAKAARTDDAGAAEAKKALADARQKLAQQDQTLTAMRQERDVLQRNLQESKRANDEIVKTLRAQNDTLAKQLTERASTPPVAANNDQAEKELATVKSALQSSRDTVASLQVRLRTLEEDRDRLEKTRRDLETRLASAAVAPAPVSIPAPVVSSTDSAQLMRVQQERDDLQKKLNDTVRELAEAKTRTKQPRSQGSPSSDEVTALRARLEALEARKVPYSPEELALFQKPQELPAVVAKPEEKPRTEPPTVVAKPEEKPSTEPPAAAATLLADAQHAFASRRFDEAEKKYQEVLRMDDKNVATLQKLAASQLEQNRPKDAAVTLKRAMDLNPADSHTLLLLGIAEYDQEQYDQALDHLSRSAQADAQNAETQNYLGITLSQKGQRAAAETALRKAIQISPGYASAHYNLAVVYATQQPPFTELARWHYQKALAFGHPQSADLEKMMERKQATTTSQK